MSKVTDRDDDDDECWAPRRVNLRNQYTTQLVSKKGAVLATFSVIALSPEEAKMIAGSRYYSLRRKEQPRGSIWEVTMEVDGIMDTSSRVVW